ncbi:MAG TPA: hypothetical protein VNW92_05190 [Polyangiaceae bacterium]|jgi:hypothetical protein|nr:hypothetical protein [Polyangiaceae bacterium]
MAARMAGYSGTPLPQKLGLKPGARFGIFAAPKSFGATLGTLPPGVTWTDAARGTSSLDVIVCFARSRAELERLLPRAQRRLDPSGGLWICWPKKASGIATDVTEAEVRGLGLAAGLVDNKVCAIDEVWSGLRMVVRVADRPKALESAPAQQPRAARPKSSREAATRRRSPRKT